MYNNNVDITVYYNIADNQLGVCTSSRIRTRTYCRHNSSLIYSVTFTLHHTRSEMFVFADYGPTTVLPVVQSFNSTKSEGIQHAHIEGDDYIIEISQYVNRSRQSELSPTFRVPYWKILYILQTNTNEAFLSSHRHNLLYKLKLRNNQTVWNVCTWMQQSCGWVGQFFLGESQSRIYPHMRTKFGRGPTVVSEKGGL